MILKKYRFVVECTFDIEDLTKEVVHRSLKRHPDYEDVIEDKNARIKLLPEIRHFLFGAL